MTSRERIKQLYYGDKKPSNKKYIVIGVAMIFVVLILFFTLGGNQGGGTTTTTTPAEQIDLQAEVDAIKVKLGRAVSSVDKLEKGQSGVTAPRTGGVTAPRTGSASESSFGTQIDDILAKIE